jgi:hypothetical protein
VRVQKTSGDLDLSEEPVARDGGREIGLQNLDGHPARVLSVRRKEDRGHAAPADQSLERVAISEFGLERRRHLGHLACPA